MPNRYLLFIMFLFSWYPATSQFYIWGESDNYQKNVDNPAFCYAYKIDGFWRQTYIYYEMVDRPHFNNEIEIECTNYDTNWGFFPIQMDVDGKDTLVLLTCDSNVRNLVFDTIPNYIYLKIPTRSNKVYIPFTEEEVPSKITILWGHTDGAEGVLTIRSKKKLDRKTLLSIQRDLSEGGQPDHRDNYYFFFSEM